MRKIILLIVAFLLGQTMVLNAHQSIKFSVFWLLNNNNTITDIIASTSFGSADYDPPELKGYIQEIHSDTLVIKILYKEHISAGSASGVSRLDTFTNIVLPQAINYLYVSTNMIKINSQGEITDTLWSKRDSTTTIWNRTDSTFVLHPVSINDIYKNTPKVLVYPNPANHILSFDKGLGYEAVQVYNSIGQCVAVYQKNSARNIDISALSKGVYFIKLYGKNTEIIGRARFLKTN